jgi:hypothetical protein
VTIDLDILVDVVNGGSQRDDPTVYELKSAARRKKRLA